MPPTPTTSTATTASSKKLGRCKRPSPPAHRLAPASRLAPAHVVDGERRGHHVQRVSRLFRFVSRMSQACAAPNARCPHCKGGRSLCAPWSSTFWTTDPSRQARAPQSMFLLPRMHTIAQITLHRRASWASRRGPPSHLCYAPYAPGGSTAGWLTLSLPFSLEVKAQPRKAVCAHPFHATFVVRT